MSKSLKNFLSIKETLEVTSASQIRIMFLLHQWDSVLDYSAGSIAEAKVVESAISNFLTKVLAIEQDQKTASEEFTGSNNYGILESELIKL